MSKELEGWQILEAAVATEVMGFHKYESPYGTGYVCSGPNEKWEECPKYMGNIYKALGVARKILELGNGIFVSTGLILTPAPGDESWEYSFRFFLRSGHYISVENEHACAAICDLSLFVKREVFSRDGWLGSLSGLPETTPRLLSREDLLGILGG